MIQKTLVILKPDTIQRQLVGDIITRFEKINLKIVALKFLLPKKEEVVAHYTVDPKWIENVGQKTIDNYQKKDLTPPSLDSKEIGEKVLSRLVNYMTQGPVVALVIEGFRSIELVRKLIGSTEPLSSDVGTIRGDYSQDSYQFSDIMSRSVRNLVHASASEDEAQKEIKVWFKEEEIINYPLLLDDILHKESWM